MKTNLKMQCPNCGNTINVDELLVSQFEQSIKHDLESELSKRESKFIKQQKAFEVLQQRFAAERKEIETIVSERVREVQQESVLKIKEREKVIEDLKLKLEDAKRRAEQGSMQLQGQIQELEIIDILTEVHPSDEITQTKNGADILHIIRTANGAECGKIYYESKRTKTWSNQWIPKLKADNLKAKADIVILVTDALPKGVERYGLIDSVWICKLKDVKDLSLVLRYGLLKLKAVAITQQGKETKMEQLYKYLTSEEFKNVFESILNGFKTLQESHQSEKLNMQRQWKQREKLFEQVLANSVDFYGSIKGIAGAEIPEIDIQYLNKAS